MADVNLAEIEAEATRAIQAYIKALINKAVEQVTGESVEDDERPDPRNQGVKTGGGRQRD
ncbi:MAG TPA: hypothetical protein VK432_08275 [Stellaceae bacterium]|nr:hypothetical protein [Stellaceae bacterium]